MYCTRSDGNFHDQRSIYNIHVISVKTYPHCVVKYVSEITLFSVAPFLPELSSSEPNMGYHVTSFYLLSVSSFLMTSSGNSGGGTYIPIGELYSLVKVLCCQFWSQWFPNLIEKRVYTTKYTLYSREW